MKSRARQDLLLGTIVITTLALFIGTTLFLYPRFTDDARKYRVYFPHAEGVAPLKPGSGVMLSGSIHVGKVSKVTLERIDAPTPKGAQQILAIVIEADIATYVDLYEDCVISSDQPPVGGGGYLVIRDVGTPGKTPLGEKNLIRGQPPQSFASAIAGLSERLLGPDGLVDKVDMMLDVRQPASLVGKISGILSDIQSMTGELKSQLSPEDEKTLLSKIHRIVDDLGGMMAALKHQTSTEDQATIVARLTVALDQLAQAMTQANGLLADNRPALTETVQSVASMARTLDADILQKLKGEFDRADPQSLLAKLHESMDHIDHSLENVASMTDTGKVLLASNRPVLQKIIDNIQEASDAMRIGMQELIVAPWKLLDKPTSDADRKRLEIFEAARRFAEAATTLDNTAVRLEAVLAAAPTDGPVTASTDEVREIRESLKAAFERYRKAEDYLFERIK
ncbi:MAG: hypothetical protein ACKVS9_00830 [Phycisphaerae bacterium]